MTNNRKNLGGRRGSKPTKVIDLEATEKSDDRPDDSARDLDGAAETVVETTGDAVEQAETTVAEDSSELENEPASSDGNDDDGDGEAATTAVIGPPVQKAKASMGSLLLSAVLGGGVALGGAGLVGQNDALQSVPIIGGLFAGNGDSATLDGVNGEIAALKDQIGNIAATSGNVSPEISTRLTTLENDISSALAAVSSDEGSVKTSEALELATSATEKAEQASQKIAELSSKIVEGAGGSSVDMEAVKAAISGELGQLSEKIKGIEKSLESGSSEKVIAELSSLKESVGVLADIPAKIGDLTQLVSEISEETKRLTDNSSAYDTRLKAIETSVDEKILPSMDSVEKAAVAAIESQKVARSVSARSLSAVLENGGVFSSELASAEALLGTSETIGALRELSRKGIKSKSELSAEFAPVGDQIASLRSEDDSKLGILDKFLSSAQSLVKVRPAGPVAGDDNLAIVSRIEAALKAGDLPGAMSEFESLDDAAKSVGDGWAANVRDNQKADGLINTLIGDLSTTSSEQG